MSNKLALLLLVLLPCLACGQTQINTGGAAVQSISVNPPTASIVIGATATFQALAVLTDGTQNIDVTQWCLWSTSNNSVASFANAGIATATGNAAGIVTVTCTYVVNGTTSNTASLTVSAAPIITNPVCGTPPCILPAGTNGAAYPGFTFGQTGCTGTNTWSVQPNSPGNLNTGLSLSAAGVISGTPTVNNAQTFVVQDVCSAPSATITTQLLSLTVSAAPCPSGQSYNPPQTYCAPIDTSTQTWPNNPPFAGLTGFNTIVTDCWISPDTFCWRDLRVSDSSINANGVRTPSSADSNPWFCNPGCGGSAGIYFFHGVTRNGGTAQWFSFNSSTFQATNLGNVFSASDGAAFTADAGDASRFNSGIFYTISINASSTSYVPYTIGQFSVNNLALVPWTSANITHTVLLDPTQNTDPCNGLTGVDSPLWNKYLRNFAGDFSGVNDSGGAGKGQYITNYRYQQEQGGMTVIFDGSAAVGSRCTWISPLTGQISIHGGTPFQMTGWGPLPNASVGPTVTLNSTGGTYACNPTNPLLYTITYTLAGVGETALNTTGATTQAPASGSGSTCSFTVTAPAQVSQPHINVKSTGYNVYGCQGPTGFCKGNPSHWFLVRNSTNAAGALNQPVINSAVCASASGSTTYTYFVVAITGSGASSAMSVPSAGFVATGTCAAKITSTNKVTVSWNAVTNATSYEVCRDFLTVCYATTSTTFTDTGSTAKQFTIQTTPNGVNLTDDGTNVASLNGNSAYPNTGPPFINDAGYSPHGVKLFRNGSIAFISFATGICSNCEVLIDLTNGANVTGGTSPGSGADVVPYGDHETFAPTNKTIIPGTTGGGGVVNPVQYTFNDNPATMLGSALYLVTGCGTTGCSGGLGAGVADAHYNYPESGSADVVFASSYNNAYALPTQVWDGEILGWPTASASVGPFRFARNYSTGLNGFDSEGIAQCSVDGKYCIFESDMCRNSTGVSACQAGSVAGLGSNSGTANCTVPNCRVDLFLNENK